MLLKYFYDERLAQASYLLGCPGGGVALVIDPGRDIAPYLAAAEANDLRIIGVAETHIHADYISGGRELAARTGATLYVSGQGTGELAYDLSAAAADGLTVRHVHDGDVIMVGDVKVEALFTPGHTPEHMSYVVTDTGADRPIGIFTGDCLFAGSVGRPDLLDATGMAVGNTEIGARQQFESIGRLKGMADYVQVWPGHGAGSACGKGLGAIPSTTLGYEKLFNAAFSFNDAESFSVWLLDGQPDAPRYFAQMKRVNRVGADLLATLPDVPQLDADDLAHTVRRSLVIDTRPAADYRANHVYGTVNIPIHENSFNTWLGWYVDYDEPVYLIAEPDALPDVLAALRAIGVDQVGGWFAADAVRDGAARLADVDVRTAAERVKSGALILDVRGHDERREQHIPGSLSMPMGDVLSRLADIPRDRPVIVQCGGGARSGVVASLLEKHGYEAINLRGGIDAWERSGLPLARGE